MRFNRPPGLERECSDRIQEVTALIIEHLSRNANSKMMLARLYELFESQRRLVVAGCLRGDTEHFIVTKGKDQAYQAVLNEIANIIQVGEKRHE